MTHAVHHSYDAAIYIGSSLPLPIVSVQEIFA